VATVLIIALLAVPGLARAAVPLADGATTAMNGG